MAEVVTVRPENRMNANPKRKPNHRDKLTRKREEEALDNALKNTFPASDPVSIGHPTPREPIFCGSRIKA